MNLSDSERRLIYTLRKLRFAEVLVHVENGCLTMGTIMQNVRFDRCDVVVDFSDPKQYNEHS